MKKILLIPTILLFSLNLHAGTWKKLTTTVSGGGGASTGTAGTALTAAQCPTGYVFVQELYPYTASKFCVAKYEMKNDGYGTAVSQMAGVPWVSINRATARAACQALGAGYDMISNDQWQTIARNIAGTASNWSGGAVASGELNRGHSDNVPASVLAPAADTDPCNGTGETCSTTTWNSQRRTHTLSSGNVIWDFAGNAWEWVTHDSNVSNGTDGYISTMSGGDIRQTRYGAASGTFCASPSTTPFCGMGNGYFNSTAGAVLRGGSRGNGVSAGVFAAYLLYAPTYTNAIIGFRCVFVP
jgi:formylglycine-generating enzyme required for sulfatase activity